MDKQYRHLTAEERAVVMVEHRKRVSLRAIARELARNASTISREVRRNRPWVGSDVVAKKPFAYDAGVLVQRVDQVRAREHGLRPVPSDPITVIDFNAQIPGGVLPF